MAAPAPEYFVCNNKRANQTFGFETPKRRTKKKVVLTFDDKFDIGLCLRHLNCSLIWQHSQSLSIGSRNKINLVIWWNHVGDVSDHKSFTGLEIQNVGWANSRV